MKIRTRSILLPALFLAGACSSAVRQPEVRLESVRVGGIGLRGGTLYASVYVGNPNGFDLETRSITYDLQVEDPDSAGEWVTFSRGTVEEEVRVEGNSSKVIEIPIQFRYDDLGGAVRSILDTGTFNYRVTGDVRLSEPIGRTFPYSKTGVVSMTGVRD
jgi:LEA14-like dessication related protein